MNYPLKKYGAFYTYKASPVALELTCPNCGDKRIAWFKNPIGGGPAIKISPLWDRSGDTLETVSLTPSFEAPGCYHGWIKNGELEIPVFSCTLRRRA